MGKLQVGIIGFGGMGHFHGGVYAKRQDAQLTAVADIRPEQLSGKSMEINIGTGAACDMSAVHTYTQADEMLAKEKLDLVSICLPTDLHAEYTVKALEAGCHVLCEKPMSRTLQEADAEIAAQKRSGTFLMIAQCLRFWPCYEKVAEVYNSGELGKLLMLSMRRVSGTPGWGGAQTWFRDGARSGGCLLDMHIHDTDFANSLLGVPKSVITTGNVFATGAIDNAVTQYVYDGQVAVMAETSWAYGGGFVMSFCAIFEKGTLEMGYKDNDLWLMCPGQKAQKVELPAGGGYEREIDYFIGCIRAGRPPARCLPFSTRESMRIALAEEKSALAGGKTVRL
jgi:predicted dehydrogenase